MKITRRIIGAPVFCGGISLFVLFFYGAAFQPDWFWDWYVAPLWCFAFYAMIPVGGLLAFG